MTDDWRLQGQERFLMGAVLCRRRYRKHREDWEHDHCEFCGTKFAERQGDTNEGYATPDGYHWICDRCFSDFRERFAWKVDEGPQTAP